jgi:hypothetical protein
MTAMLRLYEDTFPGDGSLDGTLPAMPRMIFVVHGSMRIESRELRDGDTWFGQDPVSLAPGGTGVTLWRFELASSDATAGMARGRGLISHEKISAPLTQLPKGDLLMRGDSVAFPPSGCAYLHTHQGSGIRCLVEGGIRIDTHGRSTSYGPGGAWFEPGPEPVFAQAADRPTRFIRVMILPRALLGKSSISYVNEEDKARPKSQQYKIFVDAPIEFVAAG